MGWPICAGVALLLAWWILGLAGRGRKRVERVVQASLEPGETIRATVSFAKFAEPGVALGGAVGGAIGGALGGAIGGAVGGAIGGLVDEKAPAPEYVALSVTDRRIFMVGMSRFGGARTVAAVWPRTAAKARTESHLSGIDLDVSGLGERRDILALQIQAPHMFEVRRLLAEIGVKPK